MNTQVGMGFGLHALTDQWITHGPIHHIQPLLPFDKRITPVENGDAALARRWKEEEEAYSRVARVVAKKTPLHHSGRAHKVTPREMRAVAGGHEGVGDPFGHARRNDLPQPKHAERFRPGRPHTRRSLTWLDHALRHDPDLRDDTAHPQPATHAAARSFMRRMHARAAKRVPKDSVEREHWREVHG